MKNMTYAEAINIAIEALGEGEAVERLEALKAQLAKRGSGKKGLTKTQKENVEVKARIAEILGEGEMSATEIGKELGLTCQKVSALLKQMIEAEEVVKVKEGKAIRFRVA
jgi:predicted Rossmann fold nucleotide-binding protein DprA/Smf involved in DNA uptake